MLLNIHRATLRFNYNKFVSNDLQLSELNFAYKLGLISYCICLYDSGYITVKQLKRYKKFFQKVYMSLDYND